MQSFPPSKRSGRLSTHSAFQLGRTTLIGQIRLHDGEAHQQSSCRPLLSSLHLLTILLFSLPWRTFTVSQPLQLGIWLVRRLRPPVRALAFSSPTKAGPAAGEFPSSNTRDISATLSGLLHAGRSGDNACRGIDRQAPRHPILGQVYQPLSPVLCHDAFNAGSFRPHRPQDRSISRLELAAVERLSAGFRPQRLPTADACCVVLAPLSKCRSFQEQSLAPLKGARFRYRPKP